MNITRALLAILLLAASHAFGQATPAKPYVDCELLGHYIDGPAVVLIWKKTTWFPNAYGGIICFASSDSTQVSKSATELWKEIYTFDIASGVVKEIVVKAKYISAHTEQIQESITWPDGSTSDIPKP